MITTAHWWHFQKLLSWSNKETLSVAQGLPNLGFGPIELEDLLDYVIRPAHVLDAALNSSNSALTAVVINKTYRVLTSALLLAYLTAAGGAKLN